MASIVSVEQIKGLAGGSTPNTITIPSGQTLYAPGHVIQVVNTEKLDTTATNSSKPSWVDSGLTCTITPKASNSKILVTAKVALGVTIAAFNYFRVVRNIGGGSYSMISEGTSPGNRTAIHGMVYDADNEGQVCLQTFCHLDSPSTTSPVIYKVQMANGGGGGYIYMGQSNRDTDGAPADPRAASRIILQEIAQ